MADRRAVYQLRRLMTWLEAFKECFGHRAQLLALRRSVVIALVLLLVRGVTRA